MKTRLAVLAMTACCAARGWGLDPTAQKLADRYFSILEANPSQQTALERLVRIYTEGGELSALTAAARVRARDHPVAAAAVLRQAGAPEEADTILREAAAAGHGGAAEGLADVLTARGNPAEAAVMLESALASAPSAGLWLRLGACRSGLGDQAGARRAWEEAVALRPEDGALRRQLARACVAAGDREAAVGHWLAITRDGSPADRFEAWGEVSRQREALADLPGAIAAQESLIALMGRGHWQLPEARRRWLDLHRRAGSLEALGRELEARAEEPGSGAEAAVRAADFFQFTGDRTRELAWLRKAAGRAPRDATLLSRTAALEVGFANYAEADAWCAQALAVRPGDADLVFQRAEVAALAGKEAEAEKLAEGFLAAQSGDPRAGERVEEFYRRLRLGGPLERRLVARRDAAPGEEGPAFELAAFYLGESRFADASAVLERIGAEAGSGEGAADRAFRISRLFLDARGADLAAAWGRRAFEADPGRPEYALHLADLLTAGGATAEAMEVLDRSVARAEDVPREDLDRRLHFLAAGRAREAEAGTPAAGEMQRRIEALWTGAREGTGTAGWQRLARWLRWNGDAAGAVEALRAAVERHPATEELRSALATALVEAGDTAAALRELDILTERFPGQAAEYRKRAGRLEFDRGQAEEGLRIFAGLAAASPDTWQAVVDLALAEQMAGNWFKALETWQRGHDLAPREARQGIRQPLLNAAARLQMHDRALEFLEGAVTRERDRDGREDLLREAATYAAHNQVAPAWNDRIERHLAGGEAGDWALARVYLLEAEGRRDEARAALIESQRGREDAPEVIDRLIDAAEKAGDWDEAARLAGRALALSRQPDAGRAVRLAGLLERAGRAEAAADAWAAVAAAHARDPGALVAAAEFFDRSGDEPRMESCYRGAARFGACPPRVLLRLGLLALERGDRDQALTDFETVLARTRPAAASRPALLPLPWILASRPGAEGEAVPAPGGWRRSPVQAVAWPTPEAEENEGCRLLAIRNAGRLLAHSPRREEWLQGFTTPLEKIWSCLAVGAFDRAGDLIEKTSFDPNSREAACQVYAALLIEAGRSDRLARWGNNDPSRVEERWNMVLAAVTRLIDAGWRPSDPGLFTGAPPVKRWQLASILAARNLFREACALGKPAAEELPEVASADALPASSAWLEFARWRLALRDPDGAVESLDRALACMPPSPVPGGAFAAAVRARWLLSPRDLRGDFEISLASRLAAPEEQSTAQAAAALCAALRGDHSAAEAHVDRLFASGDPRLSPWVEVVQRSGAQLEDWNLPRLARAVYRQDLARDRALALFQGQDFRVQTENLLAANQMLFAAPEAAPYFLNEWVARGVGSEELLRLAERLKRGGRGAEAEAVLEALCRRGPRDDSIKAGLLAFVDDPDTRPVAAEYVIRLVDESRPGPAQLLVQNAALRLAAQWEQAGAYGRSLDLLDRMDRAGMPTRVLAPLRIRVLMALGRFREALAVGESQARPLPPSGPVLSRALADLYAGFGREGESAAVRAQEGTTRSDTAEPPRVPRAESPADRFRTASAFLDRNPDVSGPGWDRMMEMAKTAARRDPRLAADSFTLRRSQAEARGRMEALIGELKHEWGGGQGDTGAGMLLTRLLIERKDFAALGGLFDQSLTDRHFSEADWDLHGQMLLQAGQDALAARVLSALIIRAPGNANRALLLAEALWKSGRETEARELVFPIERIAFLDPTLRPDLARFELAVGNPEAARRHLLAVAEWRADPATAGMWSRLAGALLAAGRLEDARDAITRALVVPSAVSPDLLVDFHLRAPSPTAPGHCAFTLPPRLRDEFRIAMAARLAEGDDFPGAWAWLESAARPLGFAAGRAVMARLEPVEPSRAAKFWQAALDDTADWDMQRGAAACFLRVALGLPFGDERLNLLRRAHDLDPGSFAVTAPLTQALVARGDTAGAERVCQETLEAFGRKEDRDAAARELQKLRGPLPPRASLR